MSWLRASVLLAVVASVPSAAAQNSARTTPPAFEVASIKVNKANDNIVTSRSANGRYTVTGHTLAMLIRSAYRVQEFQVVGGPEWIDTIRFDIQATEPAGLAAGPPGTVAPGPGQPTGQQLMLQSLLADRFHLTVHRETRERPVYALVLARGDRKLGPQLQRSTKDCAATRTCGTNIGPGYIRVTGVTMAQLATAFSNLSSTGSSLNRLVVDRSGLDGTYDAELRFTPEFVPPGFAGPGPTPSGQPPIDPNGPSIFTAVQEQLGLKLDAQRGPVEVLVIDRAAQPTEN